MGIYRPQSYVVGSALQLFVWRSSGQGEENTGHGVGVDVPTRLMRHVRPHEDLVTRSNHVEVDFLQLLKVFLSQFGFLKFRRAVGSLVQPCV